MKTYLVTGGAGFIGSNFIHRRCEEGDAVINLDQMTYCGNMDNLSDLPWDSCHIFVPGSVCNSELVSYVLQTYEPDYVVHFAAESHVDRSIKDPNDFMHTNALGTATLLNAVKDWWQGLHEPLKTRFRFLHVSTDEVFGALKPEDAAFTEDSPYRPMSPYSAAKAAADHLVRAFHNTYGLPVLITNCSNNYGPRQFPEKLIPLTILNALAGKPLPVYAKGENVRDWIHVDDHCSALDAVLKTREKGETYLIGAQSERRNIDVVRAVCTLLDELAPDPAGSHERLITFVDDRPGHDFRYAINPSKLMSATEWKPSRTFEEGLRETVQWYLEHTEWVERIRSGAYKDWKKTLNAYKARQAYLAAGGKPEDAPKQEA